MASLKILATSVLANQVSVDMSTTATQVPLFTVPSGKKCIVQGIYVKNASSTLGTSNGFGFNSPASDYLAAVDLSGQTLATQVTALSVPSTAEYIIGNAGDIFSLNITTGAAGGVTADIIVMGLFV